MSTQYILTDFESRNWAEPARMILAYAGANWKDNRIPVAGPGKSPVPDDIKARLTFGQVPLLEFEGKGLVQSFAIYRYLANQFDLVGKDSFEEAQCDEIVEACKDVIDLFKPHFRIKDEEDKVEGLKLAAEAAKTRFLSKFNEIAEASGGHLVGNGLTWADIVAAFYVDQIRRLTQIDVTSDLPALAGLVNNVSNTQGIKERFENFSDGAM